MENKKLICRLLLNAFQATRQFNDLIGLEYERKTGGVETVTAVFSGGGKRVINVTMDSGWRMIQDIANHIDG